MKTFKIISVIVGALLILALIALLLIVVIQASKVSPEVTEMYPYEIINVGEKFITTDVTLEDLGKEYTDKLLALTYTDSAADWKNETALRFSSAVEFYDSDGGVMTATKDSWKDENKYFGSVKKIVYANASKFSEIPEKYTVNTFNGKKKLSKSDILLDKYDYYALYAFNEPIKLSLEDFKRILDSEDCFAKHVVLTNCHASDISAQIYAASLLYYDLLPELPDKYFNIEMTRHRDGMYELMELLYGKIEKSKIVKLKVVGYYEKNGENNLLEKLIKMPVDKFILRGLPTLGTSDLSTQFYKLNSDINSDRNQAMFYVNDEAIQN